MTQNNDQVPDRGGKRKLGRRGVLAGLGAGGLATAATLFGPAASASALVPEQCCTLCCSPNSKATMNECTSGSYYVWSCIPAGSDGSLYCDCCEHANPCSNGCNASHYSQFSCQYG
jgi:hypothetical protein